MKGAVQKLEVVLLLIAQAGLVSSARGALGQQAWVQRYNGPGNGSENAFSIATDNAGNVFVAGRSVGSNGVVEYVTLKYANDGTPLWTNRYHGPGTGGDEAQALVVDRNGDVIVTGHSSGSGSDFDYLTIKYSGAGVPLWTNRYTAFADSAWANALAVDTNGNVYVTGYSAGSGLPTVKYSSAGTPLWTNRYNGPVFADDYGSAIAVDLAGNAFVTGNSRGSGSGDDLVTLGYSSAGTPLWTNRFNNSANGDDFGNAIVLDASGNLFVGGGTAPGGVTAFIILKYSNAGTPLWTNYYRGQGTSPYGGAQDLAVDSAGNIFVIGTSVGSGTFQDFATLKYSNSGVPLWTNRWNRMYDDAAGHIAVDKSGNVFVTGYTTDDTLRFDRLTLGYTGEGVPLWTNRYNGPANNDDSGNAIAIDAYGNVFVTGYSHGTNSSTDIATIKYAGVQPMPLNVDRQSNNLVLNWLNPAFRLQAAPNVTGTFTNIPGATSPYTNPASGTRRFYRLWLN
jgi:hypothetical protein